MIEYTAKPASEERYELAEGPYWDAPRNRLLWVDILRGLVLEGSLAGDRVHVSKEHRFGEMVGAVVVGDDGSMLVAGQERLVVIETDGARKPGPRIIAEGVAARNNDGATDPSGRFLIGTLSLGREANRECLYRVESDGSLFAIDTDLSLSNGLAWSPDGGTFYSVDTVARVVWKRDYSDPLGARERFLSIDGGYPDGVCIDADGNLWVAIWGAAEVRKFSPQGKQTAVVHTSAPHTSSVAFVGERLDRLLITSGRQDLDAQQLGAFPDSGSLFLADVDAVGVPTTPWSRLNRYSPPSAP
jgi:sugar lactone lactonase YvrE